MATASSVVTDWTTCPICLEVFDNPKSLPCIHRFCLKCLKRYFKDSSPGDEVSCPLCRQQFKIPSGGLEGLQHHFFIQHLVDTKNATRTSTDRVTCEVCSDENESTENIPSATIYCVDCRQKLCERCSRPHKKMAGGAHTLKPLGAELEQELIQLRGGYCEKHKDKQLELYCFDCNENICSMCFPVKHRNHNSGEIPEVAGSFRPKIEEDDEKIRSALNSVRQQCETKKQDALALASKVEDVEERVIEAGEAIKRFVDTRISECLAELQSLKSESAKQFEIAQEPLKLDLVAMESFHTKRTFKQRQTKRLDQSCQRITQESDRTVGQ